MRPGTTHAASPMALRSPASSPLSPTASDFIGLAWGADFKVFAAPIGGPYPGRLRSVDLRLGADLSGRSWRAVSIS